MANVAGVLVLLSVAVTVKLNVPTAVGVFPIVPPVKVRPVGSAPEVTVYEYVLLPPLVVSVVEYAVPTVAGGNSPAAGDATRVGGLMVMVAVAGLEVPAEFVAVY